jgi:hypothetical protein
MRRWVFVLSSAAVFAAFAPEASAQIYKYQKKDGTIVYTDSLAQLPEDRRAYYNRLEQQREQKRQEQMRNLGKEEYERQENERKLKELEQQQLDEAERQRRAAEINAVLDQIRERHKERSASQSTWQTKASEAKKRVETLLAEFNTTQESYHNLAMKPQFTLLPGQYEEMTKLKEKLDQLEKDLDAAIEYQEFGLPEEARKAGIPPGWIR